MRIRSRRSTLPARSAAFVMLAVGLGGCDGAPPNPAAASTPAPSGPLVVFTDPATGLSTTDLHDVQEQVVQLSTAGELVWTDDGTRLPGYAVTHPTADGSVVLIVGRICPEECAFEVRFGTMGGERRAYLTADYVHRNPGTLVDVEVVGGTLVVTQTDVFPPGSVALSGVVSERTARGPAPVEGAEVWRLVGYGWRFATTDSDGFYRMPGLFDGAAAVHASRAGYRPVESTVRIQGETRYDVELVRE